MRKAKKENLEDKLDKKPPNLEKKIRKKNCIREMPKLKIFHLEKKRKRENFGHQVRDIF